MNEFTEWIYQESQIWFEFHRYWLQSGKRLHIVRYEDLKHRKEETLTEMCKFLFMTDDIKDTRIEQYVKMQTKGDGK